MAKTAHEAPEQADSPDSAEFANQDEITLGVLTAVGRDANTSQRLISSELGVALGLANAYLKRCVRKGWIKIHQVPPRRYAYFLTPQGFTEKARLTRNYLSSSFTFFRRAREQMFELMEACAAKRWRRIALAGISELAEVGILGAHEHDVELVGIVDASQSKERFRGLSVVASLAELDGVDVVIVTELSEPDRVFRAMEREIGKGRVLAPPLLQLQQTRRPAPRRRRQAAQ